MVEKNQKERYLVRWNSDVAVHTYPELLQLVMTVSKRRQGWSAVRNTHRWKAKTSTSQLVSAAADFTAALTMRLPGQEHQPCGKREILGGPPPGNEGSWTFWSSVVSQHSVGELLALESLLAVKTDGGLIPKVSAAHELGKGMRFNRQSFTQLCFSISLNSVLLNQEFWVVCVLVYDTYNVD